MRLVRFLVGLWSLGLTVLLVPCLAVFAAERRYGWIVYSTAALVFCAGIAVWNLTRLLDPKEAR